MTDDSKRTDSSPAPKLTPRSDPKQDRLKAALRENLKRRKLQARERAARGEPVEDDVAQNEAIAGKTAG